MVKKATVKAVVKKPVAKADATDGESFTKDAPSRKSRAKNVVYRSRLPEPREFEIMKHRARRNDKFPGFIEWEVTAEENERFEKHPHVRSSRAVRV